ncbi:MAG: nucleoside recognition domain-containing protein [Ignavibacteriaceae bacterium]|nr:nucleoside recognition domain-containing protein [Ignavibacteriaceae bacterium]
MLNYIWIALLFLGIGAALSTDIINKTENKYRNNDPLPVIIQSDSAFNKFPSALTSVRITVTKTSYNNFYKDKIDHDLIFPAAVKYNNKINQYSAHFIIDKNYPPIWQDIASASGDKNDISASLVFNRNINDSSAAAGMVLENVSFIKMKDITNAALEYAGTAVNIAIGLIGIMALWLGIMKVAESAGLINLIASWLKPLTRRLFPDVPPDHPAMGAMIMNMSANMLGLGNAATPFGLKAMEELDTLNPDKGTATNSMVTFLAINTAGMTLIPASAIAIRAASGSSDPAIIIGTSLFGSFCATVAGVLAAKLLENLSLGFKKWYKDNIKLLVALFIIIGLIASFAFIPGLKSVANVFSLFPADTLKNIIQFLSIAAIPFLIVFFIGYGVFKKVKVYDQFVDGAKEGFNIAIRILPYLLAILVAIGIFRAGGAMQWLISILTPVTNLIGMPAEALPMALMRPLSGSGSLGIMSEVIKVHGPDSFIGILVSTFYGSTETTFYVLAVYFGAVNIKNTRHAVPAGLVADICGILGALFIVKLLFS